MRRNNEDFLVASNNKKNDALRKKYNDMQLDIHFFNEKLLSLQKILGEHNKRSDENTKNALFAEYQTLSTYIATLQAYLEKVECKTKLCFKTNKMSERDMKVFIQQAESVETMRQILESTEQSMPDFTDLKSCRSSESLADDERTDDSLSPYVQNESQAKDDESPRAVDSLSQLIENASQLEYNVSTARIWLRRGAFVLGCLLAGTAITCLMMLVMTPAICIPAAFFIAIKAILAIPAFIGIGKAVTTTTNVNMGTFNVPFTTQVPSTIGAVMMPAMGISQVRKLSILNPKREVAARNMQAATINSLYVQLKKQVSALSNSEVKTFLLSVVDRAGTMYNEGMTSWTHETQQSKMRKARLILKETAKIVESDEIPANIKSLLSTKINNEHNFGDLLNSQRNSSTFWKTSSRFAKDVFSKVDAIKDPKREKRVTLDAIYHPMAG